jgi:hypothetical protein
LSRSDLYAAHRSPGTAPILGAVCLALIGGCGGGDWGYVQGVVKLDGQPVGPGTLILEPADPQASSRAVIAYFGEDGGYELKTAADEPGVPAGEYRVRIYGRGGAEFTEESATPPPPSKIPPRYSDYSTSGLTANVQPGDNTINFELNP